MRFKEVDTNLSDLRLLMDIKREVVSDIIYEKPFNWILTNHIESTTVDMPSVLRVMSENEFFRKNVVEL